MTGKLFFLESNAGWRRIILITSCVAAIGVSVVYFLDNRFQFGLATVLFVVAFFGVLFAFLGIKKVYHWVREGFNESEPVKQAESIHSPQLESESPDDSTVQTMEDVSEDSNIALEVDDIPSLIEKHTHERNDRPTSNYFIRHWRGELSLPISYWLNATILANVFLGILLMIASGAENNFSLRGTAAIAIVVSLTSLAVGLWSLVGVWQSANMHVDRGGSESWASVAKFVVVAGFLGLAGTISNNMIPQLKELVLITDVTRKQLLTAAALQKRAE